MWNSLTSWVTAMRKFVSLLFLASFLSTSAGFAAGKGNQSGPAQIAESGSGGTQSTNSPPGAKSVDRPIRDKWALVVGIGQFASDKIPKLKYAAKDAADFAKFLVKEAHFAPDHVRLLLNEKATERRVMSELGSKFIARVVEPDDLVVVFFSTHGSPAQLDLRGANYLVAYDSDPTDLYVSGLDMQKILESINERVLTDRVLLVLDACHSGGAGHASKGLNRTGNFDAQALAQGSGQLVICSSQPEQQSWESARYKNGVFTKQLLDGLRAEGGKTKLGDAFKYVEHAVADEVKEDRPGARQTPVLNSKWNGSDLILAAVPAKPQQVPQSVKRELEPDSGLLIASSIETPVAKPNKPAAVDTEEAAEKPTPEVLRLNRKYFAHDGDAKTLVQNYGRAIRTNPKDPNLFYNRARAHIMNGNWYGALNDLSDALMNDPNKWDCYLARGFVYHMLKDEVLAREDLAQARFYNHDLPAQIEFVE